MQRLHVGMAALGGQDALFAAAGFLQPGPDGSFARAQAVGQPGGIDVGGIDEVSAALEVEIEQAQAGLERNAGTESSRAEAEARGALRDSENLRVEHTDPAGLGFPLTRAA